MVDQTTVNRSNGHRENPGRAMTRNVGEFAGELLALIELQWRLLTVDVKQGLRRMMFPAGLLLLGLVLLVASFPILLMMVGFFLVQAGLSPGVAFLIAFVIGMVAAGIAGIVGWLLLRNSVSTLNRSRQELSQNLRWIRGALKHSGRATEAEAFRNM